MGENRLLLIQESISNAKSEEAQTHALETYLNNKIPSLHHSIALPDENAKQALFNFVTQYIEHVPLFIEALRSISKDAGIYEHTKVFLQIAEDYFLNPPEVIGQHSGMHALIDEAYLAHRLVEEVNDRYMMTSSVPLIPMDMTSSNVIIYELIGGEFADQLDLAVHYSVELLFQSYFNDEHHELDAFIKRKKEEGWEQAIKEWPCLAGDSSITLQHSNTLPPDTQH